MSVKTLPSISWHKGCLENMRATLVREVMALNEQRDRVLGLSQRIDFYGSQIAEATKRGMDAFDRDKLLVKRAG